MKKKVLAVLLAGCMVASLAVGCSSSSSDDSSEDTSEATTEEATTEEATTEEATTEESTEESSTTDYSSVTANDAYTFEVIVKSYQSTYWQAAVQGVEQVADELGVTVTCNGPNSESDISDQVTMLDSAIESAPDAIALAACDTEAVLDSLQDAMDAGIPVVLFDSDVPDAPEGSVYSLVATDNYNAGVVAADNLYPYIQDVITSAESAVRIGVVCQDTTSASTTQRGLGFIDEIEILVAAEGLTYGVTGNDYFISNCADAGDADSANVIIEVAVPTQTTVELCATEASAIMNEEDLIAIFGSNQVASEGIITANDNLGVLGTEAGTDVLAVGFDAGSTIKEAITSGVMIGAVTQSPLAMGQNIVYIMTAICNGEEVDDVLTDGYWYDTTNMDDDNIAPNLYD